jgi:hypothetical protein
MLHNKCSISKSTGYLCNLLLDFRLKCGSCRLEHKVHNEMLSKIY